MLRNITIIGILTFIAATVISLAGRARGDAGPGDQAFESHFKVVLDERAAADYHVNTDKVDSQVAAFVAAHETFTLDDLQNIKIPAGPDHALLLSEIATIQVQFTRPAAKP
jgi:hypothetical protein